MSGTSGWLVSKTKVGDESSVDYFTVAVSEREAAIQAVLEVFKATSDRVNAVEPLGPILLKAMELKPGHVRTLPIDGRD